jgi:threonyl-tRNA synthetase
LSPRQAIVLPIKDEIDPYALEVKSLLHAAGFHVDAELDAGLTINKKVRNAQLAQYNFILVVGKTEMENRTVNVRTRDNKVHGEIAIDDLVKKFVQFKEEKVLNAEENF